MLKAKDIMTKNVISVKKNTPILEALQILAKNDITGIPVVREDMILVGVLSEKDARNPPLADREALSLAYAKLFLGPFEILAPPYASFYLEPDHRIMGYVSNQVAQLYAEAGLKPGPGPREAPDHAALEWEFVYFLTHQYLSTGEPIWRDRRTSFVRDHLARWMPEFCAAITQASLHPFYDAWAACVIAALPRFDGRGEGRSVRAAIAWHGTLFARNSVATGANK